MAKRKSESARVIAYFQTAPLEAAEAILGIATETVKGRGGLQRAKGTKSTRKPKVNGQALIGHPVQGKGDLSGDSDNV